MEIFLDTLDLDVIGKYYDMGLVSGITTNPTLARRFGMSDDIEMVTKLREVMQFGEIHVEAFGDTTEQILSEVERLRRSDHNLVFKIPFTEAGVEAVHSLKHNCLNATKTNMHLVFSHNQALIATKVRSDYICPLVGRLDDEGHEGLLFIDELVRTFNRDNVKTKIMVSSVRNPMHVIRAFKAGADAITIPADVMNRMFYHKLTDDGFDKFKKDLRGE